MHRSWQSANEVARALFFNPKQEVALILAGSTDTKNDLADSGHAAWRTVDVYFRENS